MRPRGTGRKNLVPKNRETGGSAKQGASIVCSVWEEHFSAIKPRTADGRRTKEDNTMHTYGIKLVDSHNILCLLAFTMTDEDQI